MVVSGGMVFKWLSVVEWYLNGCQRWNGIYVVVSGGMFACGSDVRFLR
jgi:hypothetical protein